MSSAPEEPIINIRGELVGLGPLRRDLLPLYGRWINDLDTVRNIAGTDPVTAEREADWYEGEVESERSINFTIYELPALRRVMCNCRSASTTSQIGVLPTRQRI